MNKAETNSHVEEVRKAVAAMPEGGTLIDVAVRLSRPAAQRNIQRWLGMLVAQKKIVRVGGSRSSRYMLRDETEPEEPPEVSLQGQAVWRLVSQPMAERTPSRYHRDWLHACRPNQTYFISEPVRTRLRSSTAAPVGAAVAPAWRDPAVLNRIVSDLAWRSVWWETQDIETPSKPLQRADVTAWLAQPETNAARPDVQLLWNQRAALNVRAFTGQRMLTA